MFRINTVCAPDNVYQQMLYVMLRCFYFGVVCLHSVIDILHPVNHSTIILILIIYYFHVKPCLKMMVVLNV